MAKRKKAPMPNYFKFQSKWSRWPAAIHAHRCGSDGVRVEITESWSASEERPEPSSILMTPHEAQAFAAWLSDQAEHLLAAANRKAAKRIAAAAKKGESDGK